MAEMQGASIAELREFARAVGHGAQQVDGVRRWMTTIPRYVWKGADAEAFLNRVDTDLIVRLGQVVRALEGASAVVRDQADQQEAASAVAGGGMAGGAAVGPRATGPDAGVTGPSGESLLDRVNRLGTADTLRDLAMVARGVEIPFFTAVGGVFSLLGMLGGSLDVVDGLQDGDTGQVAGGGVDIVLGAAGIALGIAGVVVASPVVIGTGVIVGGLSLGKTLVDSALPYSDESATSLLDYTARRFYGHGSGELTPSQASAIVERYSGVMGPVNMISDKIDETRDKVADSIGGAVRWLGEMW